MKSLLPFCCALILGCSSTQKPDLSTSESRYEYFLTELNGLSTEQDAYRLCFLTSTFGNLNSDHQYNMHMECGRALYIQGQYFSAMTEFLMASNQEGLTKQQMYNAHMGLAHSEAARDDSPGPFLLIKTLEEKGVEYGAEAVVLNINAMMKTLPYCNEIMPLVSKLVSFDDWQEYMTEDVYIKIKNKCQGS